MTVIKNARVLLNDELVQRDVQFKDGKIVSVSKLIDDTNDRYFDAKQAFLSAGLIDVHVHFREPGFEYKETIATGSKAAARGGFTTVIAMPNLNPVPDNPKLLADQIQRNTDNGLIHIAQYGAISANLTATKISDIKGMADAGATAFTNDGKGVQTADTMLQAMQAAASVNKPLAAHLEDDSLLHGGVMNAGATAKKLELPGITGLAESTQLARDLVLAKATGVHYHVAHISTKESVALVRMAKAAGVNVTAEVSPHHLLLADDDIKSDNALFKMNPPLRAQADREALISGLLDGTIDMVATDHAPHGSEEKSKSFRESPFGITGIETSFQLLYTHLVKSGVMTLATLMKRMVSSPAEAFQLKAPTNIAVGEVADLALFDLDHESDITVDDFQSLGKNSPFVGWRVFGKTLATWVDGEIVYEDQTK